MKSLDDLLSKLRDDCGAVASAIVGKDGLLISSDIPEGSSAETFGIMSATILGASVTAATELHKRSPNRIVVESSDSKLLIFDLTKRAILVTVVPPEKPVDDLIPYVDEIADEMKKF